MLWRILGFKGDDVTGKCTGHQILCGLSNREKWDGLDTWMVWRTAEVRQQKLIKVLMGIPERKRPLGMRKRRWENTRVGALIVATIYLQLIQNRYMFRSFTVLQCSHQHCVQPVASDVEVVGYL